jgi:hypothetical protein
MSLENVYVKVAKGLLTSAGMEIQVQGLTSSTAGRLVGRDHSVYRVPVTHPKLKAKISALTSRECREKQVPDQEN